MVMVMVVIEVIVMLYLFASTFGILKDRFRPRLCDASVLGKQYCKSNLPHFDGGFRNVYKIPASFLTPPYFVFRDTSCSVDVQIF